MDCIQIRVKMARVRVKVECLRRDPSFNFEGEYVGDRRDGNGLCAILVLRSGGIYMSASRARRRYIGTAAVDPAVLVALAVVTGMQGPRRSTKVPRTHGNNPTHLFLFA